MQGFAPGVPLPVAKSATRRPRSCCSGAYTPTQATGLVSALEALTGVAGADGAVALAARHAKSEDDARFYRRAAEILACYQKTNGPIARLVARPTKSLRVWART